MISNSFTSSEGSGGTTTALSSKYNNLTAESMKAALNDFEMELIEERLRPYIVDMSKELPVLKPVISIDGSCICSVGNISAICGEAKSRKTFLTSALVASAMALPCPGLSNFEIVEKRKMLKVLWVDTEQGEQHVRRVVERISLMAGLPMVNYGSGVGPELTTLALRELSPHDRKRILYDAMQLNHYDLVVIDGIADMQRNTNDLEESDALVAELMALSTLANTHILCVLHTNPGSDKARGHLGSSLQRKAETVLFVHRVGEMSLVEPQFCRNEPFERFAFTINEDGLPVICECGVEYSDRNAIVALVDESYGGAIERGTLITKIVERLGISKRAAQMKIKRLADKGELTLHGGIVSTRKLGNGVTQVTE